jgi:succinyl-diaminopimelate desuccinylase
MTSETLRLAQKLIRMDTTTVIDGNKADLLVVENCLYELASHAERSGATWSMMRFQGGHEKWPYPVSNVVVTWRKGNPKQHLCYMGHVDVVPVGEKSQWNTDPFGAEVKDGFLYGRGATDMKGSVAAFFAAMTEVMATQDNVHVTAIITGDEEWAAVNGTVKVLAELKEKRIPIDAFLVGEPSSPNALGTHVKSGRRGSLVGRLVSEGTQGHAAYAGAFKNPNAVLLLAAEILNGHDFSVEGESPSTNFEIVALNSGSFDASAVIPAKAEALWNIRFTQNWSPNTLVEKLRDLLNYPPDSYKNHPLIEDVKKVKLVANLHSASLPYKTPNECDLYSVVTFALGRLQNKEPTIDMDGGTTDGRFVQRFYPEAEVLEFGPPERGGLNDDGSEPEGYMQEGGMHQVNERISVKDLDELTKAYAKIVSLYHNP